MSEKIKITGFHLEREFVNNNLRLIMTDETGEEYVLSEYSACPEGGARQRICKKSEDWYFQEENKRKV